MKCSDEILRAYRGIDEDVAIEYGVQQLFSLRKVRVFGEVLRSSWLLHFESFLFIRE